MDYTPNFSLDAYNTNGGTELEPEIFVDDRMQYEEIATDIDFNNFSNDPTSFLKECDTNEPPSVYLMETNDLDEYAMASVDDLTSFESHELHELEFGIDPVPVLDTDLNPPAHFNETLIGDDDLWAQPSNEQLAHNFQCNTESQLVPTGNGELENLVGLSPLEMPIEDQTWLPSKESLMQPDQADPQYSNSPYLGDNQNYLGNNQNYFGNNQNYLGNNQNYLGNNQDYLGNNENYLESNQNYLGNNENYLENNQNLPLSYSDNTTDLGGTVINSKNAWQWFSSEGSSSSSQAVPPMIVQNTQVEIAVQPMNISNDSSNKLDNSFNKLDDSSNKLEDSSNKLDDSSNKLDNSSEKLENSSDKLDNSSEKPERRKAKPIARRFQTFGPVSVLPSFVQCLNVVLDYQGYTGSIRQIILNDAITNVAVQAHDVNRQKRLILKRLNEVYTLKDGEGLFGFLPGAPEDESRTLSVISGILQRKIYVREIAEIINTVSSMAYVKSGRFNINSPYEPQYYRYELDERGRVVNESKCGMCAFCPTVKFLPFKNSSYLSHMTLEHGIFASNYVVPEGLYYGRYRMFRANDPLKTRTVKALQCPACFQVIEVACWKNKSNPLLSYFRHFKKIHSNLNKTFTASTIDPVSLKHQGADMFQDQITY